LRPMLARPSPKRPIPTNHSRVRSCDVTRRQLPSDSATKIAEQPRRYNGMDSEPEGRHDVMANYRFTVIVERDDDGCFAYCPELQGCHAQGDTYEEALENIRDAIRLHVEDRLECGEEVPQDATVSLTSLEVTV